VNGQLAWPSATTGYVAYHESAPEQFGTLLKSHRIRRGTTQQQLADLSTVSIRAIRDLELGRSRHPRRDTVRLIADGLRLGSRERARLEAAADQRWAADDLRLIYGASFAPPPAPLDVLVGRDGEVEALRKLLWSGGHRFVSVTGAGGVGKTRLALAVADALHHGAGFPVLWNSADDVQSRLRLIAGCDPFSELLRCSMRRSRRSWFWTAIRPARSGWTRCCRCCGNTGSCGC
jgi:transcriptional regulator with XRE-family HTH domain